MSQAGEEEVTQANSSQSPAQGEPVHSTDVETEALGGQVMRCPVGPGDWLPEGFLAWAACGEGNPHSKGRPKAAVHAANKGTPPAGGVVGGTTWLSLRGKRQARAEGSEGRRPGRPVQRGCWFLGVAGLAGPSPGAGTGLDNLHLGQEPRRKQKGPQDQSRRPSSCPRAPAWPSGLTRFSQPKADSSC